jgi:hypothetical protein
MKRLILLTAALLLSGCGVGKSIMASTVGLLLPSTSDKIIKSNLKEQVEVTEADMFGVNTVRRKEIVHKGPFKDLVAGIYSKPMVTELPETGGGGTGSSGGSGKGSGKKLPEYELSCEVNLDRYANADDIKKIFSSCIVKAVLQYNEQQRTIEFPDGEAAFSGKCEPVTDPYNDLQQFFMRNKKFGYELSQGFPTPFHLLKKKTVPDLVALTYIDSSELRGNAADFEKSARELGKIFPKTRISDKSNPTVTPEILLARLQAQAAVTPPDQKEVDRYIRGIVLDGELFGNADDPVQMENRLNTYYSAFPRKSVILLAKHYLFIANNRIDDAENVILNSGQQKVDDLFNGRTIEELFESAWPDYYRAALEKTKAWLEENTDYDIEELEKPFFKQVATDKQMAKRKQLLDNPTFMEQNYAEVVIYLLVNNLIKPGNTVEERFLNTFNYYNGYDDDFAELHDFLLFNIY